MKTESRFKKLMNDMGIDVNVTNGRIKHPNAKKVLCLCRGGNSRSVGLGCTLKYVFGHDAVAAGFEGNSAETLEMLYNWADIIVAMREFFMEKVPEQYRDKLRFVEVNEDVYFHPDPILYKMCHDWVNTQEDLRFA